MLQFRVRLTPKGGRDAIDGWRDLDGARVLHARVSAPPEDGKANAALLVLLAKTLGIAKSRLSIAAGETSRLKRIELDGNAALLAKLGDIP
ncbi:MAG TPA: DUF167 family protein [Rhizomicrobium sp.]|jgi:hypothetical protein|nr:DUF167 family protein [Rhizomicrobium sp.]